jgi:hypothetical protein
LTPFITPLTGEPTQQIPLIPFFNLAKDILTILTNPMQSKEGNILAINPGTKYLALAVFQGSDLVYWGIKVLKGKWSIEKKETVRVILLNLIDRHDVKALVLKKIYHSRSSRYLTSLVKAIEKLAKDKRLKTISYLLDDVKNSFSHNTKINKVDIAKLVAIRYQFLEDVLQREKNHKHPYYIRMFEAIAAGIFALKSLKH